MVSDLIVKSFLSLLQTVGVLFGFVFCGFVGLVCFFSLLLTEDYAFSKEWCSRLKLQVVFPFSCWKFLLA